jgi:hypothetical protein
VALASSPFAAAAAANASSSNDLPEDPAALLAGAAPGNMQLAASTTPSTPAAPRVAPLYASDIRPGWTAQPLTAGDKVVIGLHDTYSLTSVGAILVSAGYEQLTNGQPNYGTDRGAFGQRLGAAALRETSQTLFTESVFAPLLHQDPRYYELGHGHSFIHRAFYAATRPLITRADSGRETVNSSLLLGYAASAALSYEYYPAINQNFRDTASTFGGSLGGAALGFLVAEFGHDALAAVHLAKKQ